MDEAARLGWKGIEEIVRAMPARHNLVIPKDWQSERPPHELSRLGRRRGALRQYRDARPTQSLHVKEYEDRWIVHVDLWNPHHHVVRHVAVDRGYTRFVHLLHWLEHGPQATRFAMPFADAME